MDDPMIERKISALEELIDKEFIDSVSNNALEIGIYDGIMSALDDPYAAYYTPEEYQEMQRDTQGIYYGIGAYLQKDTDTLYPRISGVIKNTPAEEQGLQEDDYITNFLGLIVKEGKPIPNYHQLPHFFTCRTRRYISAKAGN